MAVDTVSLPIDAVSPPLEQAEKGKVRMDATRLQHGLIVDWDAFDLDLEKDKF